MLQIDSTMRATRGTAIRWVVGAPAFHGTLWLR
jgi:hypothetical protein